MILAIIEMNALPSKRKELLQTLHALIQRIQKEKGCMKCSACQDIENEYILSLIGEWETQQNIDNHLRSDIFTVLLGAKNLLREPLEIRINEIELTAGMEAVKAVRSKTHES